MRQVYPGLFVGGDNAYRGVQEETGWAVVHAAKEPYHRAMLGYKGRATSKDHPEYLLAVRGNRLALNLIDGDDPRYVAPVIVDTALRFIDAHLGPQKLLIHCNQGVSRAPSIALAWMAASATLPWDFDKARAEFVKLYPEYFPKDGILGYLKAHWDELIDRKSIPL